MQLLRLILLSLNRQKHRSILIIIQLIFGFSSLIIAFNGISNMLQHRDDIKRLANLNTIHTYINNYIDQGVEIKVLKDVYSVLKKDSRVAYIGRFETSQFPLNTTNFEGIDKIKYPVTYKGAEIEIWANLVAVNKDMLKMVNFKMNSGDTSELIEAENTTNDTIPAVVGANLKYENPIGSVREIPCFQTDKNNPNKVITKIKRIKIVGVLDSKMAFWKGGQSTISDWLSPDGNIVIIPMLEECESSLAYSANSLVQLKNPKDKESYVKFIKEVYTKNELTGDTFNLNDELISYYNSNKVFVLSTLTFAILILTLSLFGLIGVVLSSIVRRKREFGIRYAIGSTPKNIAYIIAGEIFFIYLFANLISTIFIWIISNISLQKTLISINMRSILLSVGTTALFMIPAIAIPIFKIINTKPIDLINERSA